MAARPIAAAEPLRSSCPRSAQPAARRLPSWYAAGRRAEEESSTAVLRFVCQNAAKPVVLPLCGPSRCTGAQRQHAVQLAEGAAQLDVSHLPSLADQ